MRKLMAMIAFAAIVGMALPAAEAKSGARAQQGTGAYAAWWVHDDNSGTLYFLGASKSSSSHSPTHERTVAAYSKVTCEVKRSRPHECDFRHVDSTRLDVESFEIDPLLGSAHLIVRRKGQRGEVSWAGKGDYAPLTYAWAHQFVFPPYFIHAGAGGLAGVFRGARVDGELFGQEFSRSESAGGGMVTWGTVGASACAYNVGVC